MANPVSAEFVMYPCVVTNVSVASPARLGPVIVMLPSASLAVVIPFAPMNLTVSSADISLIVLSSAAILNVYVPDRLGLSARSLKLSPVMYP